jgi:hypothetical protein
MCPKMKLMFSAGSHSYPTAINSIRRVRVQVQYLALVGCARCHYVTIHDAKVGINPVIFLD